MHRSTARSLALVALAFLLSAAPAAAIQSTVDFLLDLDDDAATGCTVITPDGPFDGVEQILSTTVDTVGAAAANVTGVDRMECVDPGNDTFGPSMQVDMGGWPVGVGLGVDGFHVVESYFPLAATPLDLQVVRIGVVHMRDPDVATLLVAAPGTQTPILLDLRSVLEIPTLGEWGLILLALLLAASSLLLLGRRGGRPVVGALVAVLLLTTAGLAWAQCVLDGQPGDWTVADLLGADPAAADDGLSVRAVFGRGGSDELCLRADVSLTFDEPPTITPIADQTIPEDGTTGALAFTVGDAEDAATDLTVTATSSNQVLVPDGNLVLGGAGANRTVTVTPAPNQNGMTLVTVTVEDTAGGTASTTFTVTVTSENDAPTVSAIADQMILEDGTTGPLAFTVGDTETAAGSLTVTASSNDQTIIPDPNLVLGGSGANRTITVTPAADQNGGPVTITVLVQDTDGGSTPEQFLVTVTPVNDAPSFTLAGDVSSNEDAGPQVVMNQATAISAGPANEAGQTVGFQVSNDNNALFSSQPAIDAAGTLTYEAAANANGSAVVTVTAMDDGGTANGGVDTSASQMFTITVTAVNDPPVAGADAYTTVGNTELTAGGATPTSLARVVDATGVLANDSDPVEGTAVSIVAIGADVTAPFTGTTTLGGDVTMNADGSFVYVPPVGVQNRLGGMADTFQYTLQDADGGQAMGTVSIEIVDDLVWYVHNDPAGEALNPAGGDGRSNDPFDKLSDSDVDVALDDPEDASAPGHYIFVYAGDGTTASHDLGIDLESGQKLLGHRAASLIVGGVTIQTPGNGARPKIDHTTTDGVRVLANAGNGDRTGVEIRGLEISGADNAIDVSASDAGNVDVALSDNVLSSTAGPSLRVDGSGSTGTVTVTELATIDVTSAGSGGGMIFETVTFDGDLGAGGIQPVVAGNADVGDPGSPGDVVGHGVRLNNVRGILDFGTLNIGNTGGVGLFVRDADGKVGTFVLDTDGGAVNTVNGPAIDLDPVGLGLSGVDGMVLSSVTVSVTAGAVPHGINLHTVAGSFQVTGATSISASGGGMLTTGITATDAAASVTFTGPTTISNTLGAGIALSNVDGPFTVASTMSNVTGAAGAAIDVDQGLGNVTYNGSINNTAGRSVEITNHEGPVGGSTVSLTGSITDSGTGILLDNNDQGVGGSVINLSGALNLTTGASDAFVATNGGMVNVTDPANNNLAATTTGTGVRIIDTLIGGSGVKFTTVNVGDGNSAAPNAANGILLSNVGANPFTATGGAIQNVTARGLDVLGGTGNVTVGTSVSTTATGRSLEVTGHTGGTVAMSGAIDDNGLGVNLGSNTGGTINITGSMDIDTVGANVGFNATGGGTVNVMTGTNDVDTSAGTGVAVNIANTTIGGSGVIFRSVSVDGAPNGIVLNATGTSGVFEVTGDGATSPADTTRGRTTAGGTITLGSGGTITNTTGDGVHLTAAQDVRLRNLVLGDPAATPAQVADATTRIGDSGIDLSGVTNLVLDNVLISRTENDGIDGARADNTGNAGFQFLHSELLNAGDAQDEVGMDFGLLTTAGASLTGTALIENSVIDGMAKHGVVFRNFTGSLAITVDNTLFSDNDDTLFCSGATCEGHGLFVNPVGSGGGSPSFTTTVEDSEFTGIDLEGVLISGSGATAGTETTIRRTTFHDSPVGESAIVIFSDAGTNHFLIEDVDIEEQDSFLVQLKAGRHLNGTITATGVNRNTWDGDNGGLSNIGRGINLTADGIVNSLDPQVTVLIEKTDIFDVGSDAIQVQCRDNATAAATCNVTVRNCGLGQMGNPVPGEGVFVQARDSTFRVNFLAENNTVFSQTESIELDVEDATVVNSTIRNNTLLSTGAEEIDADSEKDGDSAPGPSTLCADLQGNFLDDADGAGAGLGSGTIRVDEDTGTTTATLNVVQTSAANLAAANTIPAGNITQAGAPNYGAAASCTLPVLPSPF